MTRLAATALERYFFDDGESGSDAMAHAVFDVRMEVEDACIAAAFRYALACEPLLSSILRDAPGGQLHWERLGLDAGEQSLFFSRRAFENALTAAPNLDLRQRLPIVALVERMPGHCRFTLSFHHAACDGVGLVAFFGAWMRACAAQVSDADAHRVQQDCDAITHRGRPRWKHVSLSARKGLLHNDTLQTLRWLMRRPTPIGCDSGLASGSAAPACAEVPAMSSAVLGKAELRALKRYASAKQAMLLDVLLRDAFLVLADVLAAHSRDRSGRAPLLRMSVPNNLRRRGDDELPACNVLGFAFVDAVVPKDPDPDGLLRDITRATHKIRRWNGGQMFLDGLAMVQRHPWIYQRLLRSQACFASAIFSYIGNVSGTLADLPPGFKLLRLFGRPPTRRNTRLAFFASIVDGQLNLSLGADPAYIPADVRGLLLANFVAHLQRHAAGADLTT